MDPKEKRGVCEINRQIRKYRLLSLPATLVIGFGIYLLLTGKGGQFHPWLADTALVFKLLLAAGIIDILAMNRVARLKRLKQVVLSTYSMEHHHRALH